MSKWGLLVVALAFTGCARATASDDDMSGSGPHDGGVKHDLAGHGTLDLSTGNCPGINIQTDPMNCGSCGKSCMGMHVATNACASGMCAIGMCAPGYFDVNAMASDGCECQQDAIQNSSTKQCAGAVAAGTVTNAMASTITLTGNIVPLDDEVWYEVVSTDAPVPDGGCNNYHLKITLADNPMSQFRFDLLYADCTTQASCAGMGEGPSGLTDYDFDANNGPDGGGECPCTNSPTPGEGQQTCADHSQTLRIRVYRLMNQPLTCDNYKIVITNGM